MTRPERGVARRAPPLARRELLLLAAALAAPAVRAQPVELRALMRRMAERTSGESRFTEERQVGGLDGPLYSSGTLSFTAPDRFAKHTLQPTRESLELQGRTLVMRRGGRTRQMDLDAVPEVATLLDAMRATLTGDAALLQRSFRVALAGTEARWVLSLEPLDLGLARQVRQIEIVGQGGDVRSLLLQLAGGDRSLMLIEPATPARAGAGASR